jgi:oligoendopeptidase F
MLNYYDQHVSLTSEANLELDYEDAYKDVCEGLAPLGKDYAKLLTQAKENGWIDVYENTGKRSGAYSWGCYGTHPYVLLNYAKTSHDIFTIAHELGHAMHTYYSNKALPISKANYRIFVAEVASTVNEVLLLKHYMKKATTKNEKAFFLNYFLDMIRTTIFRQTLFAEFEAETHKLDQNGTPLTVGVLCGLYKKLTQKYYGRALHVTDKDAVEWARVPHFYMNFYVYTYATGLVSAINIAGKILADPSFVDVYIEKFLSAGGSKSPYEILKDTGIDLKTKEPFKFAMSEFENTLEELAKTLEN